jgi:hypothetical protein
MADDDTLLESYGASSAEELSAPISRLEDKWKLVPAFLRVRGLVKQHIQSFDHFIEKELKLILAANSEIRSDVRVTVNQGVLWGAGCYRAVFRWRLLVLALLLLVGLLLNARCRRRCRLTPQHNPNFFLKYLDIRVGMPKIDEGLSEVAGANCIVHPLP